MSTEIDASAAAAAINAAGGLNQLMAEEAGTVERPAPAPAVEPLAPVPSGSPQEVSGFRTPTLAEQDSIQFTQGAPDAPSFSENFDPNTLPPELVPAYRQMQADYTRKTQEVAPYRSLAEQFGEVSSEDLAAAVETYQLLQDPNNWQQLHEELSEQLEARGMSPQSAANAAAEHLSAQAGAEDPRAILSQLSEPEYAPLRHAFEGLYSELDSMKEQQAAAAQAAQEEAALQTMVAEIKRQENHLRQSRPDYTDDDFNAIYELSPVYEGNLIDASARYDQMMQGRLERYLASKSQAAGNPGLAAVPGANAPVAAPSEFTATTLEDPQVDAAVKERLAQIAALESGGQVG